jgi:2-keto-4-pentenoate hydratase/2-oxohepta-3-ene-1,7-dioic acid hydratase in catechol pathway
VIAHHCSNLDAATAEQHIAGYRVYCDWTARDLSAGQMGLVHGPSKNKNNSPSLGPLLVTPNELEPHHSGKGYAPRMNAHVDARHYGGGSWDEIHWSFGELPAQASRGTTLRAGDLLAGGPVGTGCVQELGGRRDCLAPGDTVRVDVQELGAISARITAPDQP